jgi:glutaredoxin
MLMKLSNPMNYLARSLQKFAPIALAVGIVSTQIAPIEAGGVKKTTTPKQVALTAEIDTKSAKAEIAFSEYLAKTGAKFYGASWCPHCVNQKRLFGEAAQSTLPYVECDRKSPNSQADLCSEKKVRLFPSWEINGTMYEGSRELADLAKMTGYKGSTNFKYRLK